MRTLLTALLLSLPVHAQVEGDLTPEGRLGYLDAETWQPLRLDPSSLGLRFAEDLTEADVRAQIAQIELVAPGQADAARTRIVERTLVPIIAWDDIVVFDAP